MSDDKRDADRNADEVDDKLDSGSFGGLGFGARRRPGYLERRRDRIVAEIQRNLRGEYKVPTWVLTVLLVALIVGFAAFVYFA